MTYKTHLSILLISCCIATSVHAQDDPDKTSPSATSEEVQRSVFRKIRALIDDGSQLVELYKKYDEAPESTTIWQPLTADKSEIESRINRLAGNVEDILLPDEYTSFTSEYRKKKSQIQTLKSEIEELNFRRRIAPDTREYYLDPLTVSKKAIDSYIDDRNQKITLLKSDIESLVDSYSEHIYASYGLRIMPEQLEALLERVDGDDITRVTAIVGTTSDVLRGLEMQLNTTESLETAKKYYAITVLTRESLVHLWSNHLDKYDNVWIPKLEEFESNNRTEINKNLEAIRENPGGPNEASYKSNINALEYNIRVISEYRSMLIYQRDQVKSTLSDARENLKAAKLTLNTVSASSDLLSLIQDSRSEYRAILQIQLPEIRTFQNDELREKYEEITRDLNQ